MDSLDLRNNEEVGLGSQQAVDETSPRTGAAGYLSLRTGSLPFKQPRVHRFHERDYWPKCDEGAQLRALDAMRGGAVQAPVQNTVRTLYGEQDPVGPGAQLPTITRSTCTR